MAPVTIDLDQRPMLVFWESTRACLLACRHCRAEACATPAEGELTTDEATRFIDGLLDFGRPAPVLVITGGDVLMRHDLDRLVAHARSIGVHVALSPSVTPLLTDARVAEMRAAGVKVMSISLDGAAPATHDDMRGIPGHFADTIAALDRLRSHDVAIQVNTVVTSSNVRELPAIARIVRDHGVAFWEVFFLVSVGRGTAMDQLGPQENEDVCHLLYDASHYDVVVRTVEGPMFRRVVRQREDGGAAPSSELYRRLSADLLAELGPPTSPSKAHTKGTRDGRGIVFVSSTGEVRPAGFLPIALGNVRDDDLVAVYRDHPLLRDIRAAKFGGRCGTCEYRELCGGSRSRAFATSGDALAEDPACAWHPAG